jgi:hypothetical protein
MKKFLLVLGSIFLALIVLGALGVGFVALQGNALDKESKAYADVAIPAIVTTWLDKALLDRASPEFSQATNAVQVYHLFRQCESTLGRLHKCEPAQGQAQIFVTPQTGKRITAKYTAKAQFDNGEATITLSLIKHGDQWQIAGFHVDPPQVLHLKGISSKRFLTTQAAFRQSVQRIASLPWDVPLCLPALVGAAHSLSPEPGLGYGVGLSFFFETARVFVVRLIKNDSSAILRAAVYFKR